ncbi:MAG: valine--tRNA ligase [Verrucomicrobiales bacterium]
MSELAKAYLPQEVERAWSRRWIEAGCFRADEGSSKPKYSIVIPPPNVTGILTMGHVLNNTIQDILARRARMAGHEVLWLPGTDHAGIATQNVVEKTLRKEGVMKHRDELGREALVAKIMEWKEQYGGLILKQLMALGCSCDWDRTRFTMDDAYSRCVARVFVDLYHKGLIYRGKRMVNWCPASLTALSDEEVVMKPQSGVMYHFKVEVAGGSGEHLMIATTRPETIPADTAVAVNPNDPRYRHLIGRHVYRALPLDQPKEERRIPVVADEQVDFEFGTGVLKVTPAHDKTDYEIGLRHGLPVIDVLTPDGKMTAEAGAELAGLDRFVARKKAAEILEAAGALEKSEPYQNNVGFSERADVPIEPRLSEQWFLRYPSVAASRAVVAEGRMKFFPDRWAKVYDHWLEGIQDWCISRQLWWGHRIPVWYRGGEVYCGEAAPEGGGWEQDPDVLDTWFSSWLWPFATMGWTGDATQDAGNPTLGAFYPTTDLVTGPDIIFFWVARMIMAGYEYMGEMPFRNVYFTGIIRDKQGRKMSKSLGNSPDPFDLIAKYGADGLRFGIMRIAPTGTDVRFDETQIEEGRNFANKVWNACRYRQMQGAGTASGERPAAPRSIYATDILAKLDALQADLDAAYANYEFNTAAGLLYDFFWSHYCDLYLETIKGGTSAATLATQDEVLRRFLPLLHPFMPHITEELWSLMGYGKAGEFLMQVAVAPSRALAEESAAPVAEVQRRASSVYSTAARARHLKAECGLASARNVVFVLKPSSLAESWIREEAEVLRLLAGASAVTVDPAFSPPTATAATVTESGDLYLPLEGLIDIEAERARLRKEMSKAVEELAKAVAKLANAAFAEKAPDAYAKTQAIKAEWEEKRERLAGMLKNLE